MNLSHFATGFSNWLVLALVAGIPLIGQLKKVPVYESFVEGAKEGFEIAVRIIPYLVAMLVAIGMLKASGAFNIISYWLAPVLHWLGMPKSTLPLALIRPFSGSGANAVLAQIVHSHGGNSYAAKVGATMMGSTETTFYVVAVYFGAVNVRRTRHAIPAGLLADFAGIVSAVLWCHLFFGH